MLATSSLVMVLSVGMSACEPASQTPPPGQDTRGVVFVVGGVGGWDMLPCSVRLAFPVVGVPHEIRDFVWTHGIGQILKDLQDHRHLEQKAHELAEEIQAVRLREPRRPIFLLAKSGGTAVALQAAELLPPATLERIILLAAAVSPSYDLRPALCATRGEIVSYYSPFDQVILNWGTRQFGTGDRVYGPSAGLYGFQVPRNLGPADEARYQRLVQIRWNPRMLSYGYMGGHAANSFPGFLMAEVVPWLR